MEKKILLLGWILFIISALGFIASSIHTGDTLELIGSVFFLLACFVFMIPLFVRLDRPG